MHKILLPTFFSVVFTVLLTELVWATPTIVVGDHDMLPDTSGQTIPIMVHGGDAVQGMNFHAQIADGGPHPDVGGSILGPSITSVDLVTATIFEGNTAGQTDVLSLPQISVSVVTTLTGTVAADGLLATITIDTAGFSSGTFDLSLENTRNGPTDFAGIPIEITDGSIRIVPEPSTAVLLMLGAGLVAYLNRFRRGTESKTSAVSL